MTEPKKLSDPQEQPAPEVSTDESVDAAQPEGDAPRPSQGSSLGLALKAVAASVWLLFIAALVLVGGLGFIAGTKSPAGVATRNSQTQDSVVIPGEVVNLIGARPGQESPTPKAKEDGSFDATIFGPKPGATLKSPEDLVNVHRRLAEDPFAMGPVDAPVVMTVFSDFECPFCAKFATETEKNLIKDYVERGLLRIEWNDMALNGKKAIRAAVAGRAAAAQGKFWEFTTSLFDAAATKSGHPEFTDEDLIGFAEKAEVPNMDLFRKDLTEETYKKSVMDATEYGAGIGVGATPQFLIGTTTVSGALPEVEFRDRIELELMKAARAQ